MELVRYFSKQGTPTSCGVCCAVLAYNVVAGDPSRGPALDERSVRAQSRTLIGGALQCVLQCVLKCMLLCVV